MSAEKVLPNCHILFVIIVLMSLAIIPALLKVVGVSMKMLKTIGLRVLQNQGWQKSGTFDTPVIQSLPFLLGKIHTYFWIYVCTRHFMVRNCRFLWEVTFGLVFLHGWFEVLLTKTVEWCMALTWSFTQKYILY